MNHVIEINNLSKDYETGFWRKRKVRALDSLDLNVKGGQIFGFLGGNGAGKTTTIKILMSLLYPTEGMAKILGRDISDVQMHSSIGYCPENPYFYDYLTAREIMNYFGELFGLSTERRKTRTEQLLTSVGLSEKDWDRQLRKFSKGMLQRVGLAQALINSPEVVFLDEPMSGLDPIGRREIRELIVGLREKGTTVFMSTHILSDVESLCDEVAILRKGRLAATGNLTDLLSETGGTRSFEIVVSGVSPVALNEDLTAVAGATTAFHPSGARIEVLAEEDIDRVFPMIRKNGGRLVSVTPVKQSLEDLFVRETKADEVSA
ncbi:MAG: ABC transporter ATP-binding protein [Blastocatellia bacterium]|nr:ABC transporter ATP-binding protein [Blastocatellia bacterium]